MAARKVLRSTVEGLIRETREREARAEAAKAAGGSNGAAAHSGDGAAAGAAANGTAAVRSAEACVLLHLLTFHEMWRWWIAAAGSKQHAQLLLWTSAVCPSAQLTHHAYTIAVRCGMHICRDWRRLRAVAPIWFLSL
jgi:hypothetical protein